MIYIRFNSYINLYGYINNFTCGEISCNEQFFHKIINETDVDEIDLTRFGCIETDNFHEIMTDERVINYYQQFRLDFKLIEIKE